MHAYHKKPQVRREGTFIDRLDKDDALIMAVLGRKYAASYSAPKRTLHRNLFGFWQAQSGLEPPREDMWPLRKFPDMNQFSNANSL